MFKIISKQKLLSQHSIYYLGMTFDEHYYYLTQSYEEKYITQMDQKLKIIKNIKTIRNYNYICFDQKENCFWAISSNYCNRIYKLNKDFCEIDIINLACSFDDITGISYNICNDFIILSTKDSIYTVNKATIKNKKVDLIKKFVEEYILGIGTFNSYIIVSSMNRIKIQLILMDINGDILEKYSITDDMYIKSILFTDLSCSNIHLNLLANEGEQDTYFIEAELEGASCIEINNAKDFKNLYRKYQCNQTPEDNCCFKEIEDNCDCHECDCSEESENEKCCNEYDFCKELEEDYDSCFKTYKDCEEFKDKCCLKCKNCPYFCSNNILESIALVETSIAHILNAEGEKLQKILSISCNVKEILDTNREINKTIINMTHLEQALYQKLIAYIEHINCKKRKNML